MSAEEVKLRLRQRVADLRMRADHAASHSPDDARELEDCARGIESALEENDVVALYGLQEITAAEMADLIA